MECSPTGSGRDPLISARDGCYMGTGRIPAGWITNRTASSDPSRFIVVIGFDRLCHAQAQLAEFQA
jgi:hypothetical protein